MCTPNKTGVRAHQMMCDGYFKRFIHQHCRNKRDKSQEDEYFIEEVKRLEVKRNREKPYWRDFISLLSTMDIDFETPVCLTPEKKLCKEFSQAISSPLRQKRKMCIHSRWKHPMTWLVYDILEYSKIMWWSDEELKTSHGDHDYLFGLCSLIAQIEMGKLVLTESNVLNEKRLVFYLKDAYGRLQYASEDNTTELILLKIIHQETPQERL